MKGLYSHVSLSVAFVQKINRLNLSTSTGTKMRLTSRRKKERNDPKAWSISPPSPSWTPKSANLQKKAEAINLILLQPHVDLWKLRELCLTEGGLVNDTLRQRAWPKLVGLHQYGSQTTSASTETPETTFTSTTDDTPKFEIDASVLQEQEQGSTSESSPFLAE